MTINEKILKEIKKIECEEKYKKTIKELLVKESEKSGQWHWRKTYNKKLEDLIDEDDNYEI